MLWIQLIVNHVIVMTYSTQDIHQAKHFLRLVEETCRRAGGKNLLSRDEYLAIVNDCYQRVYSKEDDAAQAS